MVQLPEPSVSGSFERVTYGLCHRCQAELPSHSDGELIYCSQCGAAQVLLSEQLLDQMEEQASAAEAVLPITPTEPSAWAGAIRCAALAGAITAVLMASSALLPIMAAISFLWILSSPVVVMGIFHARFPVARITTGFGARLGMLTGLAISLVLVTLDAIQMLAGRYAAHRLGEPPQDVVGLMIKQLHDQAAAQPDPMLTSFINSLNVPEFRAGFLLLSLGMLVFFLMVTTTAGGAFAGYVRSKQNA